MVKKGEKMKKINLVVAVVSGSAVLVSALVSILLAVVVIPIILFLILLRILHGQQSIWDRDFVRKSDLDADEFRAKILDVLQKQLSILESKFAELERKILPKEEEEEKPEETLIVA